MNITYLCHPFLVELLILIAVYLLGHSVAANVPADDGNGFNLPSADDLFPDANDTSLVVMASKVISQAENPFLAANGTSNGTLEINSAVVMLALTNSSGAPMSLGDSLLFGFVGLRSYEVGFKPGSRKVPIASLRVILA